jgi:hypothetical protein
MRVKGPQRNSSATGLLWERCGRPAPNHWREGSSEAQVEAVFQTEEAGIPAFPELRGQLFRHKPPVSDITDFHSVRRDNVPRPEQADASIHRVVVEIAQPQLFSAFIFSESS